MTNRLERLALQRRLRVGAKRRIVLKIFDRARDPLTARDVHRLALAVAMQISLSTIQRTLPQLVAVGLLRRLPSRDRKARYEKVDQEWREYLVDAATGRRLAFRSESIESLLKQAMRQLGYRLLDYRLELLGQPVVSQPSAPAGADAGEDAQPRHPAGRLPGTRH